MPKLRVVEQDETAPPKSVTAAAESGTRRELLVAMRARVASAVQEPNTPARDLAALTRRLMELAKDIEAIDVKDAEEGHVGGATEDASWESEAI